MLLSSVILVLREVLEAALLFSLLLAMSGRLGISYRWVAVALLAGLLGAAIYGFNIDIVSELFDGVGQEIANAFLQIAIYIFLCMLIALIIRSGRGFTVSAGLIAAVMTVTVALAIIREGSEILVYLSGFLQIQDLLVPVLTGSAIGAGIGVSVGGVFYYALLNLAQRAAIIVSAVLIIMVAAGMVSQAAQLLIQADWLPSQYPIWDSSWLVDEQSVAGQLLYALLGYEATPTPVQTGIYLASMVLISGIALLAGRLPRTQSVSADA